MDNEDITIYGMGGYSGMSRRPAERPLTLRALVDESPAAGPPAEPAPVLTGRLAHLRDEPGPAWKHGVPPLRPAENRGERTPTRGGRRYSDIYLAEHEYSAGDIELHFEGRDGRDDIIGLRMADFAALQAAVTDPARPVTARQVSEYLRELLSSDGPMRDGWDPADAAALHRVLKLTGEG
jgi:hypothetical protein